MNERKRFVLLFAVGIISIAIVIVMRNNIGQEFISQL